jgi:predicted transcriptional regulator
MVAGMRRTRIAALTAAGALVAAGSGVAVATTGSNDPKEREQAVLADAAKRLDVQTSELRDALAKAEDAQLDADVKAGRLTQEQADKIKQGRAQDGTVLGGGPGGPGGPHPPGLFFRHEGGPGVKGPGETIDAAAKALGISRDELFQRLRDGKTLEEIAKAEGKSLSDVKAAVKTAAKKQLDEAVKAGKLTQAQADEILSHMTENLGDFGRFGLPGPPPERPADLPAEPWGNA